MALSGKNKHYRWNEIMPRHWFEESKKVNFPETEMQAIIDQTIGKIKSVINQVTSRLPEGFPEDISEPIFDGLTNAANRF